MPIREPDIRFGGDRRGVADVLPRSEVGDDSAVYWLCLGWLGLMGIDLMVVGSDLSAVKWRHRNPVCIGMVKMDRGSLETLHWKQADGRSTDLCMDERVEIDIERVRISLEALSLFNLVVFDIDIARGGDLA